MALEDRVSSPRCPKRDHQITHTLALSPRQLGTISAIGKLGVPEVEVGMEDVLNFDLYLAIYGNLKPGKFALGEVWLGRRLVMVLPSGVKLVSLIEERMAR